MKTIAKKLTICALLGLSAGAHAAPVLIPNGDFSTPGGSDFGYFESAPGVVSFQETGGNGGGYGLVNNTLGSWGGGLVSPPDNAFPANQGIPLANLGLVAGNTYTFSMDMKNFAGTGTGGLKLEAWNGGAGAASNTGDMPATGSSTSWATYSWNYLIPVGTTSIKIVPLLTGASGGSTADSVGFDNIKVNNTPVPPPPFVPDTIINGDFETAGGAGWGTTQGTPAFPTTGGNPSGHTQLDGTAGFAVLYAFNNTEKTFASLGLAPGDVYTFQMDMKLISGSNIGFLRLEGPAGYVIDGPAPAVIGNGSEWATYSIELTVPASPGQSKFGLRPGDGSVVAFDNVKIVLPAPPGPLQANIATGVAVSWTAASAVNRYQPQESPDGTTWTNLGSAIIGNTASSIFDDSKSPFYQVLESAPIVQEAAYNGNFTEEGFDEDEAEGWTPDQTQWPTRLATGGRTDNGACMQIKVLNSEALPNGSEISQNTNNVLDNLTGEIVPGNSYTLSFWAKQISSGASYVQEYRVTFLAENGAELPPGGGMWQGFSAPVGGDWAQKTLTGLVAPAGAVSALIQIVGKTGAVEGGLGEVLIDDVSLQSAGFGAPNVPALAATVTPTVEISWLSKTGKNYQVGSSPDLSGWSNLGGVIAGDGSIKAVYDSMVDPKKFYRVGVLP
jgi:hypothetical protein